MKKNFFKAILVMAFVAVSLPTVLCGEEDVLTSDIVCYNYTMLTFPSGIIPANTEIVLKVKTSQGWSTYAYPEFTFTSDQSTPVTYKLCFTETTGIISMEILIYYGDGTHCSNTYAGYVSNATACKSNTVLVDHPASPY